MPREWFRSFALFFAISPCITSNAQAASFLSQRVEGNIFVGSERCAATTTITSITCEFAYTTIDGLHSEIVQRAKASAQFGRHGNLTEFSWANLGQPAEVPPFFGQAMVASYAVSHFEGQIWNHGALPMTLSIMGTMGGVGIFEATFLYPTPAPAPILGGFGAFLQVGNQSCTLAEASAGNLRFSQSCTTQPYRFTINPSESFLLAIEMRSNTSSVFRHPPPLGNFPTNYTSSSVDFMHTSEIEGIEIRDELGNLIDISSLEITTDAGVRLSASGFVPESDIPESQPSVFLMLGFAGIFIRKVLNLRKETVLNSEIPHSIQKSD